MKSHLELDALTYSMFPSPMCLIVKMVGAAVTREAEIHVRHPQMSVWPSQ